MGKLGKFQTLSFSGWSTKVTKENHINSLFYAAPQKAANFMVQLFAANYGKSLESTLSQFPTKEFESADEYTWDLIGSARRNITLLFARNEEGQPISGSMVGSNTKPFELVFAEEAFFDGEVIFGNENELYPMLIKGDPRHEGTNVCYTVELMGGNTAGIPSERLQPGEKFSAEYAPVEKELSRKVGGVRHATPASMRNEWTTIRLGDKVSGALLNKKLFMGVPVVKQDASGKLVKATEDKWMHYEEYAFDRQWAEYKNSVLAYGTSNRNEYGEYLNYGKSGEVIRMGDGLYPQMSYGNIYYYNDDPLPMIEAALISLSAGRLDFGNRTFTLRTGEYGAAQFSKSVQKAASGWTMFDLEGTKAVSSTSSKLHSNSLKAGFQFTEYVAPNNVHLIVEVDPYYDDPVRNKVRHPKGGLTSSYRYDIFDFGSTESPNIFKTAIKGEPEYRGFQSGMRNPYTGAMNNDYMSFDEDAAVMHRQATLGICVLDPTRTASFIYAYSE